MPLVKLPSGEFVDPKEVKSVTRRCAYDDWYVDVNMKSGETIAIACTSEDDAHETLERVGTLLGVK